MCWGVLLVQEEGCGVLDLALGSEPGPEDEGSMDVRGEKGGGR